MQLTSTDLMSKFYDLNLHPISLNRDDVFTNSNSSNAACGNTVAYIAYCDGEYTSNLLMFNFINEV